MKWRGGVISTLFSFVYGPAFTYLRIISHYCNASESNFKENLGIQDILIHQVIKFSKFTPSCICNMCWSVGQYGVITMMISLEAFWLVRNFWMIDMSELWIKNKNCNKSADWMHKVHKVAALSCTKQQLFVHARMIWAEFDSR